jgi:hypothetical protein
MKFNWGKGIFLTYALFFVMIMSVVVYMSNLDVNLVTEDYYDKELKHQEQIDKETRTNQLPEKLQVNVMQNRIRLKFPSMFKPYEISGTVQFYRPSDSKLDFSVNIALNDSLKQIISTTSIQKGYWRIKVDWSADNIDYFNEKLVMIN